MLNSQQKPRLVPEHLAAEQPGGQTIARESFRILFDARKIFDGGIGYYSQNILASAAGTHKYTLLLNPGQYEQVKQQNFDWFDQVEFITDRAKVLSYDDLFFLADRLPQSKFDFYQTPYLNLPYRLKIPAIVTIHDLIQITHPEKRFYPFVAKNLLRSVCRRAAKILTVSQSSGAVIRKYLPVESKITILQNQYKLPAKVSLRKIEEPYLLGVFSNLKPHKSFEQLIACFGEIKKGSDAAVPKNLKLVLAGYGISDLCSDSRLMRICTDKNSDIKLMGSVSEQALAALYKNAEALVISSNAEGFCLPVIQAHSFGVPFVAKPVPAVSELATQFDILSDDFSVGGLKKAVLKFFKQTAKLTAAEKSQQKESLREIFNLQNNSANYLDKITAVYQEVQQQKTSSVN